MAHPLLIALNSNGSRAAGHPQDYAAPGQPLQLATNANGPDYAAAREAERANIGKPEGVPGPCATHAKTIAAGWPMFLVEAKSKGVPTDTAALPELWAQYVREMFAALDQRAATAQREALAAAKAKVAPNAAQVGADGLTAVQRKIAQAMHLTPAQLLAERGEAGGRAMPSGGSAAAAEVVKVYPRDPRYVRG